jgi:hypothetical protein
LQNLDLPEAMDLIVNAVIADNARRLIRGDSGFEDMEVDDDPPAYLRAMNVIENAL